MSPNSRSWVPLASRFAVGCAGEYLTYSIRLDFLPDSCIISSGMASMTLIRISFRPLYHDKRCLAILGPVTPPPNRALASSVEYIAPLCQISNLTKHMPPNMTSLLLSQAKA